MKINSLVALTLAIGALAPICAVFAQDTVALPTKLPKPNFIGTPADSTELSNVEKPLGKPRPVPMVPRGTVNLALKKKVTASVPTTFNGTFDMIVDGNKEAQTGSAVEIKPRLQWVQIDLEASCELSFILFWHFHEQAVVVHDVIVQVSDDPAFLKDVTTLFNNDSDNSAKLGIGKDREYFETSEGKLVAANKLKARYVRLYSKGSTFSDPLNRYTEIEVFGLPAK
jgi:hypothetical protein